MPTISANDWDVQDFHDPTHSTVPAKIVGPFPLDVPDSTYLWPEALGGGVNEIGLGFWDPVDVTDDPSPRFRLRAAGTASGTGFQAYPSLSYFPLGSQHTPSAQIGADVFPYPLDWRLPGDIIDHYEMDSIQEVEFLLPDAVRTVLRDTGLAVMFNVSGSGLPVGIKIHQCVILTGGRTKAPPCRLTGRADNLGIGSGRIWPPPNTHQSSNRRGGGSTY